MGQNRLSLSFELVVVFLVGRIHFFSEISPSNFTSGKNHFIARLECFKARTRRTFFE